MQGPQSAVAGLHAGEHRPLLLQQGIREAYHLETVVEAREPDLPAAFGERPRQLTASAEWNALATAVVPEGYRNVW